MTMQTTVAALFVQQHGVYFGMPNIDPWDIYRDARTYAGPHPVVAHPPCKRWGRFWHGSPSDPHKFGLGDDGGCFVSAIGAVRRYGGVLEHPADSRAWDAHGLNKPDRCGGWVVADNAGGWTCYVEQGFYGHAARKPTWLYAVGCELPSLRWGKGAQRLHPSVLAKHGYEKARRMGMISAIGGKDKERIRDATPIAFRDLLISIAERTL